MAYLNSFLFFALPAALASFATHAAQNRQDFCVGTDDPNRTLFVNGRFCKNPANVTVDDFIFSGLNIPTSTNNKLGFNLKRVNVVSLPGLNTLGISCARFDFAPYGLNPLHSQPRNTKLFIVVTGTFYVGFVSSSLVEGNIVNKLFAKVINEGDVFVFPKGLPQFQMNLANTSGLAFALVNSEDFGTSYIDDAVFGAQPSILPDVIARSFNLDINFVKDLQASYIRVFKISSFSF